MLAETHIHTRFSDGSHHADEVASKAVEYGCEAIAITDHADRKLKAATPEYYAAIGAIRSTHPQLVVLAGLEWNIPPYRGREHATVLFPSDTPEENLLAEFKRRFDDYTRDDPTPPVEDALTWLATGASGQSGPPVVLYNHPSRKDASSLENVDDVVRWRAVNRLVAAFEGAPGHQGKPPIGSYEGKEVPIDRWDPVVARAGDAWDALLLRGVDFHGAIASSDFHNANPDGFADFWPCQFAETWYFVPERTASGLFRALRAGSFFGAHGHIVRNVELSVSAAGLSRPAVAGESIEVPLASSVTVAIRALVPDRDWEGQPNHLDAVEVFVITPDGVTVRTTEVAGAGLVDVRELVTVGEAGAVIRARGRRIVPEGPDLMFYTNAIRISARH